MLIGGADPSAEAIPRCALIKLLIRARRFNAAVIGSDGVPLPHWLSEGVSPSYSRGSSASTISPRTSRKPSSMDQPRGLTADKLLALASPAGLA
jgi:hypothetical protein